MRVNDRLEKLEKYTHRLSDISDYLITAKYPKAADHANEVADFLTTLDRASTQIFKVIHDRHAAAPQADVAAPPAPATRSTKPSAELKPKELLHDASMASFRTWKKQFQAYFDAGNLITLPCSQQQAYLNNCVDETLASRIDRESTGTTPVYSPVQGLFTCIKVLDGYFLRLIPSICDASNFSTPVRRRVSQLLNSGMSYSPSLKKRMVRQLPSMTLFA